MIKEINDWFSIAKPQPNEKDIATQIGCHFEEIGEMQEALGHFNGSMILLAGEYKMMPKIKQELSAEQRLDLLDSLCDQIVTAIGIANYLGMDIVGALAEVNRANYSKFENGKPVLDDLRKIQKGKDYQAPNLEAFI